MEISDVEIQGLAIPSVPHTWINSPHISIPRVPSITDTIYIGVPIINIPGCVEAHKDGKKNKVLKDDDPDGTQVFCDAETPSFDPIEYTPEDLIIIQEAPPPPVANTEQPPLETPPIPEIPKTTEDKEVISTEEQSTTCLLYTSDAADDAHGVDLAVEDDPDGCLLYTSPSPRDTRSSRMPSSA